LGLETPVHFSAEDECFFGKIEGVDDLVTFEGRDVDELSVPSASLNGAGPY
jgi:predicted HicB family RNase H-like nuclease